MSNPAVHPRRSSRFASPKMPLQKSDTFHPRTGLNTDLFNPRENTSPKRSPTSLDDFFLKSQQDLFATRQERVANYLRDIDNTIRGESPDAGVSMLNDQEIYAVPSLNTAIVPEPMAIDEEKKLIQADHHHGSDSGLGSSVDTPHQETRSLASALSSVDTSRSAITSSYTPESSTPQNKSQLSKEALRHIRERILRPILEESSLEEFHPLINSIPNQVDAKFIANLRDLEKTLLYETPRFSLSPSSYIKFWEFSIECLHTTVDFLTDRDQKRPSDRPYTNNYFLDLVEQIRRYAEIMRRTREKQENGEDLDEMDYSPEEQIAVEGGLTTNGKPAELVRKKDGKSIPLVPEGSRRAFDDTMSLKRSLSDDEFDDDDDVLRSMARRRKSDKAGDVMHICTTCRKEFKRPCDLTKHEKTHSRPFKCTEPSCRYHELGWPTEKERDRHVNDKHSSAPKMYHCKFPPCSYSSKRESNCKQHMEKAHNWTYVRSKSNGRKKTNGSIATPSTPLTPFDGTPGFTPESHTAPSPWFPTDNMQFADQSTMQMYATNRRDSTTTAATNFTFSSGFSPDQLHATMDTAPPSENLNVSPAMFTNNNMDLDFNLDSFTYQQPTPAMSADFFDLSDFPSTTAGASNIPAQQQPQEISPMGQGDITLFSPQQGLNDEGFDDGFDLSGGDFLLFPSTTTAPVSNQTQASWFPEMNNLNGQFDGFNYDNGNLFPQ